jgi:uncharacterized membrane protein
MKLRIELFAGALAFLLAGKIIGQPYGWAFALSPIWFPLLVLFCVYIVVLIIIFTNMAWGKLRSKKNVQDTERGPKEIRMS